VGSLLVAVLDILGTKEIKCEAQVVAVDHINQANDNGWIANNVR
jgi:hypothetical protein